jgi:hypothetical protein
MSIRFHVLAASGALSGAVRERLDATLAEASGACSKLLTLAEIDVVVMNVPHSVIPRIGVNGWSYDAHQLQLVLDIEHAHLKRNFSGAIKAILAHELHHCARSLALGLTRGYTYGESLVAEGLACCFEEEIGEPTPFYALECRGEILHRFSERAKAQLDKGRGELPGDWNDWMFGRTPDDPEFPYQCGYSTGYAIVRCWLDATGGRASSAAGVDASEIVAPWLCGRLQPFK